MKLKYEIQFFIYCQLKILKGRLFHLGCLIFPSWYYVNHNSICTTGNVLKVNMIYCYKESRDVNIVRLLDIYKDKGYLYCTLYFFDKNKIITVSQILQHDAHVSWRIMDNKEYDEILSRKLWQEVDTQNDLLEFNF